MASHLSTLPERPRRYRFVLTPLADAMFQLLIFFMLSTSLTPYSLITLKTAAGPAPDADAAQAQGAGTDTSQAPPPAAQADLILWTLSDGRVRTGGQDFDIEQIGDLADAVGAAGVPGQVVLIIDTTARIQDVAMALEALDGANVDGVQITREGS
ncbi:biopolymer transporter ExbD [Tateyamaria sp. ANG-S1]|uniref:ExbD/TolR family protein n=1 Tax=Tateyamaria sp. ANG-S1 TaxID=1577905 RepID=UPI00057D0136|nr:biopolymer transporter ExbD [Tateyamaria sp. ANG-S1]KIC47759.1 hypothetical protein RA29_19300 [Tateyamaria sp. ANG-S1]